MAIEKTEKLPTKVLPDGTKKSVTVLEWAQENLPADEFEVFKNHFDDHIKARTQYHDDGHGEAVEIIENGVVVGWDVTHSDSVPLPQMDPATDYVFKAYREDPNLSFE